MSGDNELANYLGEARGWDADRRRLDQQARRTAWTVASVAVFVASIAVTAILAMLPLRRVEPYVIRVDNATGIVDVVPSYTGKSEPVELVTRYLLTHYVATCERFQLATAEEDYSECGAFNSARRNQQWAAQWATGNPDSPLNKFKDGTTVHVNVEAVSFFVRANGMADLAQVRFTKSTRVGGSGPETLSHWINTIHYAYGRSSSDAKTRRWNPLGFHILDVQTEPEIIEPPSANRPVEGRP